MNQKTANTNESYSSALAVLAVAAIATASWFLIDPLGNEDPLPPVATSMIEPVSRADVERERRIAREWLDERLEQYEAATRDLETDVIRDVEAFFENERGNVGDFAEAALTWRSRWLALTDAQDHAALLRDAFDEEVVAADDIRAAISEALLRYTAGMVRLEESLLADARSEFEHHSILPFEKALAPENIDRLIEAELAQLTDDVNIRTGLVAGRHLAVALYTIFGGGVDELAIDAITSLPIPFMDMAAGRLAHGIVKFVIGQAFQLLQSIIGVDDEDFETAAGEALESLRRTILDGSEEARSEHAVLEKMVAEDSEAANRAEASEIIDIMERNGHLGLQHTLRSVREKNIASQRRTWLRLIEEIQP